MCRREEKSIPLDPADEIHKASLSEKHLMVGYEIGYNLGTYVLNDTN